MVKSRLRFRVLLTAALLAAVAPMIVVRACGPFFEPEVFTPGSHPEKLQVFATGKLGVLQPNYWRADKIVAYRYLNGGHLSEAEQKAYAPPPQPATIITGTWEEQRRQREEKSATGRWLSARSQFTKAGLSNPPGKDRIIETQRQGFVERDEVPNCTDGAFDMATATLQARAKTWGSQSPDLRDWLTGQDNVFSNCTGSGQMPQPPSAGASQLLKQDRAYQIAAAHFYAGQYDDAIPGFETIAKDKSSPWSKWGEYLAARAEIRKAAFTAPSVEWGEMAKFDPALMQSAKTRLLRVAQTGDPQMKHAALAEISFVNVRLEPKKHLNDAASALAGPAPDPNFSQDLDDLRFLTGHSVTRDTDLLNWMGLGEKTNPSEQWKSTKSLPWLVAALAAAKPADADTPALMDSAAGLPSTSPAYVTANYHRVRLMLLSDHREQARELATTLLASLHSEGMAGSRNAVLALRMPTAPTLAAFLADAARTVISSEFPSEAASDIPCVQNPGTLGCLPPIPPQQFDGDATAIFNSQLPLSLWVDASNENSPLPKNLREGVAWTGWARAVVLNDEASAKRFSPMLPATVRTIAGDSAGFPATFAMLRNPGLRPYLDQGVQRSASYHVLDSYRDNWWCTASPQNYDGDDPPLHPPSIPLTFLTPEEKDKAKKEQDTLSPLSDGVAWLGRRAIDYAKAHPNDPHAAESLYLTVRATRYGCSVPKERDDARRAVSKEAFQLLHTRFPKSPWTAKTPYYY
jgi:hypothetical protein